MRFDLIIIVVGIVIILIFLYFKRTPTKYTNVKIGNASIKAEIADTSLKKIKGLMFRKQLQKDQGMLFVFNYDNYHGIWMMNMSFPIDIIWIDNEKKVVDVVRNAQPCLIACKTYSPKEKELALKARDYTRNFLERPDCYINIIKKEKYGRYLCEVFAGTVSLNKSLIAYGYAKEYHGEKREKWFDKIEEPLEMLK